ncbi:MAG: lipoyl domain-containing protein, partial [Chloroflexi bacterium]|nr:lipoyl domain-containing protein [Chloroflexota bacterium]
MAEVTMPRLSDTMEEGTIAAWLKQPGEQVNKGEVIAQIETDKATMDLTAFEAGTLQEILAPEGSTVAIGKPVARIGSGAAAEPTPTTADGQAPAAAEPAPTPADGRPPGDQKPAPQVSASADQTPPPPSGGPDQQDIAPED